jgi:5-formyltetrahydrofolate cyclo-ligase
VSSAFSIRGTKAALRSRMRDVRRSVGDPAGRSALIWAVVQELPAVRAAGTVMAFESIPGEPDTSPFLAWCRERGATVILPEDDPPPALPDVVVVPGLAFAAGGHRLGQGGGWYDRFLSNVRSDCVTIGVAFAAQVLDELPIEAHDVALDVIVTDEGMLRAPVR